MAILDITIERSPKDSGLPITSYTVYVHRRPESPGGTSDEATDARNTDAAVEAVREKLTGRWEPGQSIIFRDGKYESVFDAVEGVIAKLREWE